jgi:hypothetical protein
MVEHSDENDYIFTLRYDFKNENEWSSSFYNALVREGISNTINIFAPDNFWPSYRIIVDNVDLIKETEILRLKQLHELFKIDCEQFDFILGVTSSNYEGEISTPPNIVKLIRELGGNVIFSYLIYDE